METQLVHRLQNMSREQLLLLVQELATRHPTLLAEMTELLERFAQTPETLAVSDEDKPASIQHEDSIDEEVTEDWDFSGEEVMPGYTAQRPILLPLDQDVYQRRITSYEERLKQGESQQAITNDLTELLDEAETRAEHHDYQNALDLYALVFDERFAEKNSSLTSIFDKAIEEAIPILEILLTEASSSISFDPDVTLSPLLTPAMRHRWLERLFKLWLKHLDARHTEENIPGLILDVAWSEDIPLLRTLVQAELPRQPRSGHSNIVDFTRQYRVRALEKFLKELPMA